MIWSPISELPWIGRRPVYSLTFVAFLCFSVLAATAQSWKGYLVIRFFQAFFGSPCLATGGASMHDLFPHSTVPFSLTIWIAAAFCGPALGPVLAGYIVPEKGWHLGMWEIAYMAGPTCVLLLLLPETYEPAIKAKRAKALRGDNRDGADSQQSRYEANSRGYVYVLLSSLREAIIVPFQIAVLDPSVAVANAYTSFIYATYYTLFDAIPRVYPVRYRFTSGELGLSFLHVFVACVIAGLIYCAYVHKILNPANRRGLLNTHEDRLRPALIACFLPPIGLFLFAWTSNGKIHWMVGLIGLTIYSMGTFVILQCLSVYTPRIYPSHSASLFASNDFCRSSLATAAIHFGVPLYGKLGVERGVSILATLVVLGIPSMWLIYWKGASLRGKSRFVTPKAVLE
jgi:DHA1 family multidrug resistance protein-like MFS transporter